MTYLYFRVYYFLSRVFYSTPKLSREGYLKSVVIDIALLFSLFLFVDISIGLDRGGDGNRDLSKIVTTTQILFVIGILVIIIRSNLAVVRRLHDLGLPPTYWFLLLLPLINFFILFQLFFGQSESERKPHGML